MGARTRADLSVLLILFRIERGKGAFRRVGCIELRYDVSGAYVITVPCIVDSNSHLRLVELQQREAVRYHYI